MHIHWSLCNMDALGPLSWISCCPAGSGLKCSSKLNIGCMKYILYCIKIHSNIMSTTITIVEKYYHHHDSWPTITTVNNYRTIAQPYYPVFTVSHSTPSVANFVLSPMSSCELMWSIIKNIQYAHMHVQPSLHINWPGKLGHLWLVPRSL